MINLPFVKQRPAWLDNAHKTLDKAAMVALRAEFPKLPPYRV